MDSSNEYAVIQIRGGGHPRTVDCKSEGSIWMDNLTSKTTAVFSRPFTVPGFDETLPAGEYEIETELSSPPSHLNPQAWKASVLVHLNPRISHPGLARSLTLSLVDLDKARAKDKLSGRELSHFFLEEMLSDPMVRLVMQADGVSEAQLRHLYSSDSSQRQSRDVSGIERAENEGMPTRTEIAPPRQ